MIQVIQLLLSLSILVVLHEFGHYAAARFFGCRVEKFYLFMDWGIGKWDGVLFKRKLGHTEFGVGWAPLGGYVKIAGFIDESMDVKGVESEPKDWELRAKPAWQRLIVMLGGIFVNIVFAWLIYTVSLFSLGQNHIPIKNLIHGLSFNEGFKELGFKDGDKIVSIDNNKLVDYDPGFIISSILFEGSRSIKVNRDGKFLDLNLETDIVNSIISNIKNYSGSFVEPNIPWVVSDFSNNSPLKNTPLRIGDRIVAIDNVETPYITASVKKLLASRSGKKIDITYLSAGEVVKKTISITVPQDGVLGVVHNMGGYYVNKSFSLLESVPAGLKKTTGMIKMYWGQVKTMFNPKTGGYKHVGGIISIGKMFPGEWNWLAFWSMTALLSIILAIMNLLPIPALDGGHALIAIIEIVSGKKLPLSVLMPLQIAGMVFLFALLIYANGMDIFRLFN